MLYTILLELHIFTSYSLTNVPPTRSLTSAPEITVYFKVRASYG